jgi:hypothetical protein
MNTSTATGPVPVLVPGTSTVVPVPVPVILEQIVTRAHWDRAACAWRVAALFRSAPLASMSRAPRSDASESDHLQGFSRHRHWCSRIRVAPSRTPPDAHCRAGGHRAAHIRAKEFVEATAVKYGFSSKVLAELGGGEKQRVLEFAAG